MSVRVAAACACVISVSFVTAVANEKKYDESVQKAAAEIAAAQMGEIRGSIDYDQVPVFTKRKSSESSQLDRVTSPKPGWTPEPTAEKLPPVTRTTLGIDNTATGSIQKQDPAKPVIQLWDRFDRYGNRVDRYGNRID